MARARIYCDYNAGAPVRPEACEAVMQALALGGNPSSVHQAGRRAKALIEGARETVAAALGARSDNIIFTSGATEALHLALRAARAAGVQRFIFSAIEHDALAEGAAHVWPGADVLPVTPDGVVDLAALDALLAQAPGALVAVMLANNETGAIQPIADVARRVREAGGLLLVDAAQAVGRLPVDLQALDAAYLIVSSHKIGGPPGAGALALGPGAPFQAPASGGGQERGRRPGTENVPAISGFAAAIAAATRGLSSEPARLSFLRDALEAELGNAAIFANRVPRVCNTSLFAVAGLSAETALIGLDLEGVALSSGAACSSGKVRGSRVLAAMGVERALAQCALRASFGWASTEDDAARLLAALATVRTRARPILEGAA